MSRDVVLVCMPFTELPRPPLAPSLLAAILQRDGLTCDTLHANLLFAERIGLDDWISVVRTHPSHFILEYLFSHVAFPNRGVPLEDFVQALDGRHWSMRGLLQSGYIDIFQRVMNQAHSFVNELAEAILAKFPAIVGCSSTFIQQVPSLALLRVIKEKSPKTVTMLGGANCESVMGISVHRHCPWVDVVVSGEADGILSVLVCDLIRQGANLPIADVPEGVFVPEHRVKGYPPEPGRLSYRKLDDLPVPDYHEYFETLKDCSSLNGRGNFALSAESSRGCWWGFQKGCTFCGLNGRGAGYGAKDPQRFLDELHELNRRHQTTCFSLTDNIISKDYFTTFLPLLQKAGAPYNLFYETKSNLRRRHVEAFRKAGVIWIQPGIESLSSKLLAHMRKGAKAWEHVLLLRLVLEYGIRIQWFILHDFPGEQDEWYADMVKLSPLLTHLQPPVNMIPLQYCRFSEYYDHADQYGLQLEPPYMARYAYPFEPDTVKDFMSVFEPSTGRNSDDPMTSLLLELPSKRQLRSVLSTWMTSFWQKRAVLEMIDDGSTLSIRDTRAVAVQANYQLKGTSRILYLSACEECPKLNELDAPKQIAQLVEARLAVELDGRLVGLAVVPARYPFPPRDVYPGGKIFNNGDDRSALV